MLSQPSSKGPWIWGLYWVSNRYCSCFVCLCFAWDVDFVRPSSRPRKCSVVELFFSFLHSALQMCFIFSVWFPTCVVKFLVAYSYPILFSIIYCVRVKYLQHCQSNVKPTWNTFAVPSSFFIPVQSYLHHFLVISMFKLLKWFLNHGR